MAFSCQNNSTMNDALTKLGINISERREKIDIVATLIAKIENCSSDDEEIDIRTLKRYKVRKSSKKTKPRNSGTAETDSKQPKTAKPNTVPVGVTEEDEELISILHDGFKKGKKPTEVPIENLFKNNRTEDEEVDLDECADADEEDLNNSQDKYYVSSDDEDVDLDKYPDEDENESKKDFPNSRVNYYVSSDDHKSSDDSEDDHGDLRRVNGSSLRYGTNSSAMQLQECCNSIRNSKKNNEKLLKSGKVLLGRKSAVLSIDSEGAGSERETWHQSRRWPSTQPRKGKKSKRINPRSVIAANRISPSSIQRTDNRELVKNTKKKSEKLSEEPMKRRSDVTSGFDQNNSGTECQTWHQFTSTPRNKARIKKPKRIHTMTGNATSSKRLLDNIPVALESQIRSEYPSSLLPSLRKEGRKTFPNVPVDDIIILQPKRKKLLIETNDFIL